MTAALAVAWGALVLTGAWRCRPAPARVRSLARASATASGGGDESGPAAVAGRLLIATVRSVRKRVATVPLSPVPAAVTGRARRLGRAAAAAVAGLVLFPPAAPLAAVGVWAAPVLRGRRRQRRAAAEVLRSLPEVVDLFVLAAGAGLTVPLSVAAVARRATGPVAGDLARVLEEVARGRRLADALETVPASTGEVTRPLIAALVASERYGAPLLDRLTRLAAEGRADRRRRAEAAARRVPVKLLFPLVCCTLPAFGLLTVAPLLAGALTTLRP